MPFNNSRSNNRSSSSNRNSGNSSRPAARGGGGAKKLRGGQEYNMLSFGIAYLDDNGKLKSRILMKNESSKVGIVDERGNEYAPEEAAQLVAEALLLGRGISIYWFENDDGSTSGNARIDINGLDAAESEPAPAAKRKAAPAAAAKRKVAPAVREYPPIVDADLDDEDDEDTGFYTEEEEDDSEPPY